MKFQGKKREQDKRCYNKVYMMKMIQANANKREDNTGEKERKEEEKRE